MDRIAKISNFMGKKLSVDNFLTRFKTRDRQIPKTDTAEFNNITDLSGDDIHKISPLKNAN